MPRSIRNLSTSTNLLIMSCRSPYHALFIPFFHSIHLFHFLKFHSIHLFNSFIHSIFYFIPYFISFHSFIPFVLSFHSFILSFICFLIHVNLQKSGLGSREGTPARDGDNISVNSGDILGDGKSPPGSPARKRKYPNMAMGGPQQSQNEPDGGSGGVIKTNLGEPSDGGFFSVKFYQSPVERCFNNGL